MGGHTGPGPGGCPAPPSHSAASFCCRTRGSQARPWPPCGSCGCGCWSRALKVSGAPEIWRAASVKLVLPCSAGSAPSLQKSGQRSARCLGDGSQPGSSLLLEAPGVPSHGLYVLVAGCQGSHHFIQWEPEGPGRRGPQIGQTLGDTRPVPFGHSQTSRGLDGRPHPSHFEALPRPGDHTEACCSPI